MTVGGLEKQDLGETHGGQRKTLAINGVQWIRSEEATSKPDLWDVLASPLAQRRGVARAFADAVSNLDGINAIWITDLVNDLDVAVVLGDADLEPQVRNVFIDLVCERLDPREGELFVFPSDCIPDWVTRGTKLT